MSHSERQKFRTVKDWHEYLKARENLTGTELRELRRTCYKDIEDLRGCPLLVYATDFINAPGAPVSISLFDVDGFADLVSSVRNRDDKLKDSNEVDVLVHSPGGTPDATERIVNLLRRNFEVVNFIVPHSAYSAATMLALSGNEVILHPVASLGPIDPQINGTPARAFIRGFEKVRDLLKEQGPEALPAYMPLIGKYSLELLETCRDAEALSRELVTEWLGTFMFKGESGKEDTIKRAVEYFADQEVHKTHGRPLVFRKIKELGLNIRLAESEEAELIREAYLLINGLFASSAFVRLYEDSQDLSWGAQWGRIQLPNTQDNPPPSPPNRVVPPQS